MAKKKNQHFVPQFYLREFSYLKNRKQIGIFDIETKLFVPTAKLKFQASRKNYYGADEIVENHVADIENLIAPVLSEIIKSGKLPKYHSEAHFKLLTFVVLSFVRTTVHENSFNEGTDKMFKEIYSSYPDLKDGLENFYIQFSNSSALGITQMAELIPIALDLSYKLLINDSNVPFITSDNPVVKYNLLLEQKKVHGGIVGLGTIGLKIFLPLTPDMMLLFYDQDSYSVGITGKPTFEVTQDSTISDLNLLHFLNCERIIFFDDQSDETYIRGLHKKSESFNRANQAIVTKHELRDQFGKALPDSILHSRTTECRIGLQLPFVKISPKGRKYQPISMAHIRPFPRKLIDSGLLGATSPHRNSFC